MSGWRAVTSVAPQGTILGSEFSSIFVSDIDIVIKCNLSKPVDDTKVNCEADITEGRDTILKDLGA